MNPPPSSTMNPPPAECYALAIVNVLTGKLRLLPEVPSIRAICGWIDGQAHPESPRTLLLLLPLGKELVIAEQRISAPKDFPFFTITSSPTLQVRLQIDLDFKLPDISPSIGWPMTMSQLVLYLSLNRPTSGEVPVALLGSSLTGAVSKVWILKKYCGLGALHPGKPLKLLYSRMGSVRPEDCLSQRLDLWPNVHLPLEGYSYVIMSEPVAPGIALSTSCCLGLSKIGVVRKFKTRRAAQPQPQPLPLPPSQPQPRPPSHPNILRQLACSCHVIRFAQPSVLSPREQHVGTKNPSCLVEIYDESPEALQHIADLRELRRLWEARLLPPHLVLNTCFPRHEADHRINGQLALVSSHWTSLGLGPGLTPDPHAPISTVAFAIMCRLLHLSTCICLAPDLSPLLVSLSGLGMAGGTGHPLRGAVAFSLGQLVALQPESRSAATLASLLSHPLCLMDGLPYIHLPFIHFVILYCFTQQLHDPVGVFEVHGPGNPPRLYRLDRVLHDTLPGKTGRVSYTCYHEHDGEVNQPLLLLAPRCYTSCTRMLQFFCFQGVFARACLPEQHLVMLARPVVVTSNGLPDTITFRALLRSSECLATSLRHTVTDLRAALYLETCLVQMVSFLHSNSLVWPTTFGLEDLAWDTELRVFRLLCSSVATDLGAPSHFPILPVWECEEQAASSIFRIIGEVLAPNESAALEIAAIGRQIGTLETLHTTFTQLLS